MRATARVYWRLLVAGFRRQSAYRLAALGGLVANLTFGLLKVALLFATVRATITTEAGASLFALIPRGLPSVLLGAVTVGILLPTSPVFYLLGAVSLLLGITISAATVYLIAVAGFWLVETRGLQILYMLASGFLGGLYLPISLFPQWLRIVAAATPFPSIMMYPIDVLSGFGGAGNAVELVLAQLAWLAGVAAIGQLLTRAGRRRLEVQGG
jgi:ABC-2 type transport system permease protein